MADFEYSVTGQSITTTKAGRLVTGTVGVYTVSFTFDESWDGLEKWATFDPNPGQAYKQPLDANGECTIPGEVMAGITLRIGAFGLADGQAYPTVWANILSMEEGCFVNVPVSDYPEPSPVIQELQEELETKVDKVPDAEEGNVAIFGNNGNIEDSGKSLADIYDAAMISKTASGSIVTIEDGADGVPVKSMTVQIEPVQTGSGDPSPSNVRAITGWTGTNIRQTAKNLYKHNGDRGIVDAWINTSGSVAGISDGAACTVVDNIKGNTKYYIGYGVSDRLFRFGSRKTTVNAIVGQLAPYVRTNAPYDGSMITSAQDNSIIFQFPRWQILNGWDAKLGVSETPIAKYHIDFPSEAGTVYGGTVTVNEDGSGTLTVDKEMVTISQITWSRVSLGGHYVFRSNNLYGTASQQGWCECYTVVTGVSASNVPDDCILLRSNSWDSNNRIAIRDDTYEDATAFKNAMGSYKIVREAKNPATYQLTAPQVRTLLGLNNIWADTGDIAVEYHADPTIYVEERTKAIKQSIAPVEEGYTASQAYAVGAFLYVGDTLYKVTSAIASGATITPNTNCAQTTIAEEIKAIYAYYG